jgi:hypothetical protein
MGMALGSRYVNALYGERITLQFLIGRNKSSAQDSRKKTVFTLAPGSFCSLGFPPVSDTHDAGCFRVCSYDGSLLTAVLY